MSEGADSHMRLAGIRMLAFSLLFLSCLVQWRMPVPVPRLSPILPLSSCVLAIILILMVMIDRRRLVTLRPGCGLD